MIFNDILTFYGISQQYTNPGANHNALCYVCSDTDIPMTDFTQEGEDENE